MFNRILSFFNQIGCLIGRMRFDGSMNLDGWRNASLLDSRNSCFDGPIDRDDVTKEGSQLLHFTEELRIETHFEVLRVTRPFFIIHAKKLLGPSREISFVQSKCDVRPSSNLPQSPTHTLSRRTHTHIHTPCFRDRVSSSILKRCDFLSIFKSRKTNEFEASE